MLDYGEFLPDELDKSPDENLRIIGEKMDLRPFQDACPCTLYKNMIQDLMNGTHSVIETRSYLR